MVLPESPGLASFIDEKGDSEYNQHEATRIHRKLYIFIEQDCPKAQTALYTGFVMSGTG